MNPELLDLAEKGEVKAVDVYRSEDGNDYFEKKHYILLCYDFIDLKYFNVSSKIQQSQNQLAHLYRLLQENL